jgi:hypothetical protein
MLVRGSAASGTRVRVWRVLAENPQQSRYQPILPLARLSGSTGDMVIQDFFGTFMSPNCLAAGYSGRRITLVQWVFNTSVY